MNLDPGQIIGIAANIGVIAGIVFLAVELRQNNRHLAAQARYALRQYRADIVDSFVQPHVLSAMYRIDRGEEVTPEDRGAALMISLKALELWEWQYGEYAAGMLQQSQLPIAAWRVWYDGEGPMPVPIKAVYEMRREVLNPGFVQFFEDNVVNRQAGV